MFRPKRFEIIYAPIVKYHLKSVDEKYYPLIRESIEEQLRFEPEVETKNRKRLKRSVDFGGQWELRFGPNNRFRIFYRVDGENSSVMILAIGEKHNNRLFIGGIEVEI